jgi:hypothetical protein
VNEAKVSVVYVLVMFLVLFRRDIVARPLQFLGIGLAFVVLLGILITAYTVNAFDKRVDDWRDLIKHTYEYNVVTEETTTGKLSRWGDMRFWVQQHGMRDIPGTLLGHGAGISRPPDTTTQTQDDPELDRKGIGFTAVAAILWEGGVVALLCVFGLFWAGFRAAGRLAERHRGDGWRMGLFQGIQAGLAVLFVSLWHSNFFVFQMGYQVVLFLLLGYLAYWERRDQMRNNPVSMGYAGRGTAW